MKKFNTKNIKVSDLKPHPKNYRHHPSDQLDHIIASIQQNGFYRNVVVANDNTILAGHGVVLAAKKMGMKTVPAYQIDVGPNTTEAYKVMTGDNEISHLGEIDDRMLSELLSEINTEDDTGLLGTGYDEMMLTNLLYISRPADEIANKDEAAEYIGMSDYQEEGTEVRIMIKFFNPEDREEFFEKAELDGHWIRKSNDKTWSVYYKKEMDLDLKNVRFEPESDVQ